MLPVIVYHSTDILSFYFQLFSWLSVSMYCAYNVIIASYNNLSLYSTFSMTMKMEACSLRPSKRVGVLKTMYNIIS